METKADERSLAKRHQRKRVTATEVVKQSEEVQGKVKRENKRVHACVALYLHVDLCTGTLTSARGVGRIGFCT